MNVSLKTLVSFVLAFLLSGCAAPLAISLAANLAATSAVQRNVKSSSDAGTTTYVLPKQTTSEEFTNNVRTAARELGFNVVHAMSVPAPTGMMTMVSLLKTSPGFLSHESVSVSATLAADNKTITLSSSIRGSELFGSSDKAGMADAAMHDFKKALAEKYTG